MNFCFLIFSHAFSRSHSSPLLQNRDVTQPDAATQKYGDVMVRVVDDVRGLTSDGWQGVDVTFDAIQTLSSETIIVEGESLTSSTLRCTYRGYDIFCI